MIKPYTNITCIMIKPYTIITCIMIKPYTTITCIMIKTLHYYYLHYDKNPTLLLPALW